MKYTYEKILEKFLLQTREKDQIRSFFSGASFPAKIGYLKAIYKTGTSIIDGYYVEFCPNGIEIARDESEKYTWQQVADKIDGMIRQGKYGNQPIQETGWEQLSMFNYQGEQP